MVQISENEVSKAFVNRVLYPPQNEASILLCLDTSSSMIKTSWAEYWNRLVMWKCRIIMENLKQ